MTGLELGIREKFPCFSCWVPVPKEGEQRSHQTGPLHILMGGDPLPMLREGVFFPYLWRGSLYVLAPVGVALCTCCWRVPSALVCGGGTLCHLSWRGGPFAHTSRRGASCALRVGGTDLCLYWGRERRVPCTLARGGKILCPLPMLREVPLLVMRVPSACAGGGGHSLAWGRGPCALVHREGFPVPFLLLGMVSSVHTDGGRGGWSLACTIVEGRPSALSHGGGNALCPYIHVGGGTPCALPHMPFAHADGEGVCFLCPYY